MAFLGAGRPMLRAQEPLTRPLVSPLWLPVRPVVTPALAAISSLVHPCWAVPEVPGISRAGHGRSGYHVCPLQHRSCSATRCREGAQGTACSPKTGSCSSSCLRAPRGWVPMGTAMRMAQGCSSSLLPCDLPLLGPRVLGTARPAARGGPGAAAPAPRGSVSGGIRAVSGKGLARSRRRGAAQCGSPRCHRSGITNKTLAIS